MPRKKSGKGNKSHKSSSSMVSDISNSQLHFPLATSSPRESAKCESSTSLNTKLKDLKERAEMFRKKTQEIEDIFNSKVVRLKVRIKEILKKYPEDVLAKPAKVSDLKALRLTHSTSKSLNGTLSKKRNHTELENDQALPCIPEEIDSSGSNGDENIERHEKAVPSSEEDGNAIPAKRRNKVQFNADEDDAVFKKPTGRGKRTLKNSQQFSSSSYNTPKQGGRHYNVAVVTPGPNSEKPVHILRRPNPGEMAISMTGSPLLVAHQNVPSQAPQISIPLSDGRVMTVLANEALDPDMSICSDIDSETCERLTVLHKLLSKKLRMK